MFNQPEKLLEAYPLKVERIIKGRGNYVCKTIEKDYVLMPFGGQELRAKSLANLLVFLQENNPNMSMEQVVLTREGHYLVADEEENRYLLKEKAQGREHSLLNENGAWKEEESKEVVRTLARLHKSLLTYGKEPLSFSYELEYQKKLRLLIRVKNYMRSKNGRNDFERIYLETFPHFIRQAQEAVEGFSNLPAEGDYIGICHGDFNQHNIFVEGKRVSVCNFENIRIAWPVSDFVNYLRKLMEKLSYDFEVARKLFLVYEEERVLSEAEKRLCYNLFLFPEKFYKLTNHYDNTRKSLVTGRQQEKLKELIQKEEEREAFLINLFSFLVE